MQLQPAVKRLVVAVLAVGASAVIVRAQPPVVVAPAFNLTFCPPPGGTFLPCSLFTSTAAVSNGTTVETDLISYPMPANVLSVNGHKLKITVWGTAAANANTKTLKIYFGATSRTLNNVTTAPNSVSWKFTTIVARITNTTQTMVSDGSTGSALQATAIDAPTETLTGAITIKITGQSSAASGDVTTAGMLVEFVP